MADFDKYIDKEPSDVGYYCNICEQYRKRARCDVRNHIESRHFPNSFVYNCPVCGKEFNTHQAFAKHQSRDHRQ